MKMANVASMVGVASELLLVRASSGIRLKVAIVGRSKHPMKAFVMVSCFRLE